MNDASTAAGLGSSWRLTGAVLGLCAIAAVLGARGLDAPGLYYDEVIQAEPAVQFLTPGGAPVDVPGMQTVRLFGGWFPLMTQTYMGALKSQALIPVFAAFDATKVSLRATTFAWGLCGLLFSVLWAHQLLGLRGAVLAGALLAVDPSFLFIARHDWGSFSLALLCRSAGLFFAVAGARRLASANAGAAWRFGVAGLLFGAGLFNKIDSAVVLLALLLAAMLAVQGEFLRVMRGAVRERFVSIATFTAGIAVGALPLLASLGSALSATSALIRGGGLSTADWSEKLHTLASTLDGSYFHRLMLAGGSFEEMFAVEDAAADVFPALLVASALTLIALRFSSKSTACDPSESNEPGKPDKLAGQSIHTFLLVATVLGGLGMFFTPRAVRVHHVLNLYPLPHLLVAAALQSLLFNRSERTEGRIARRGMRAAAALALAVSLATSVVVDVKTLEDVRTTGGRGRWSDAIERFAGELASAPNTRVVSFAWGFAGPLRFAARTLSVEEPFWKLWLPGTRGPQRRPWSREGTPHDVYLVQEKRLEVFPFGAEFTTAISALPPEWVEIRHHIDRVGDPAFTSIRIARPHRLVYREGFEVHLR